MEPQPPPTPVIPRPAPHTAALRRFVLSALAVIIAAWSLAQFTAVRLLVEQSYQQFERQDGLVNARRLEGFLSGEAERLLQIARDWGYWNDTLDYVRGKKPEFVADNFDEATFDNLAVDYLMVSGADGNLVYYWQSRNPGRGADSAEASTLFESLQSHPSGKAVLQAGREFHGVVHTRRGLMVIAAVPILDNARRIRPAGMLLFGRDIDVELLAEGKEHSVVDADLFLPGRAPWPPDVEQVWQHRTQQERRFSVPVGEDALGAYVTLTSLDGQPVGILRSLVARDTKHRFEAMARYLLWISLLLAALLALAVVWVLERRVLAPMAAISRVVSRVARNGDLTQRVPESSRQDELAQLGRELNLMLSEIANQQQLRDARDHALAASAQKSEFLANMSHEIRTPMNGILGMLELVLETTLTAEQQERVQTAYRSAESLLSLLNDILDLSKMEAGKLTLESREFDLRSLVEDVVALFAPKCEQKGIAISCHVDAGGHRYVGDPLRVQQVLSNLLGNAVKFTAHGEVSVEAMPGATPREVRIVVADTGIGIAPERLALLFQPFAQVDASMARRYGGSGLGLAICRQLVERMQGTIEVASVPGRGTRFACTLPLDVLPAADIAPPFSGRQALVIGPHDGTRRALTGYLRELGFDTLHHLSADAIDHSTLVGMDLLALDDTEPDVALGALRRQAISLSLPVVRLTSFNRSAPGASAGGTREQVLSKPVLYNKLRRALEAALQIAPVREPRPLGDAAVPPLGDLRGRRVLLVEDNAVNQALALAMLDTYEMEVDCAESGGEALEKLSAASYDLVLMDCQMPEMDGLTATRHWRVREARRGGSRVPIVALTANAMTGDRDRCMAAGMDDYLAKPFNRAALTDVLRRWIAIPVSTAAARDLAPA